MRQSGLSMKGFAGNCERWHPNGGGSAIVLRPEIAQNCLKVRYEGSTRRISGARVVMRTCQSAATELRPASPTVAKLREVILIA
jgi:hypothetical protein